ncbi:MAG TPA: DMT family transporter [Anaerolineae bacterium]|nr:DMT family transporter [Anaerolineae bacterium]
MFIGELAALGTAVCWSFTALFFSYSGRRIGADVVNRSRLLFAILFLMLTHRLTLGTYWPTQAEPFRWFWFSISSILGLVIGDTLLFRAYATLGARLSMLIMATVPIFSALFDWLLFREILTRPEFLAVILTVSAVGWVVTESPGQQDANQAREYRLGLFYAFGGALGQVANLVTAKYGLTDNYSPLSATLIRIFVATLILWLIAAYQGQIRQTFQLWRHRQAFPAMIGGSIAGPFLGIWLSLIAVQFAPLGIASTLMALPPILILPLDAISTRTLPSARAIIGTVAAVIGVALLFMT